MQQRQPRVGDTVIDYCPRERRLSDHAVVAMVGDVIRQTRCTTCDSEHLYREGKIPAGRKKSAPVLPPKPPAGAATGNVAPKLPEGAPQPVVETEAPAHNGAAAPASAPLAAVAPEIPVADTPPPVQEGPVHRRLIRAVLPRIEGEVPTRQAPEFTMHTANQRPAAHGRPHRGPQGGQPRHGSNAGHGHQPGGRSAAAGPYGQRGPGGPHGHGGPGGQRHGRPQGVGQGPRKKH